MKKGEIEAAMPTLLDKWVEHAKEPWLPDGLHHYSFGSFWTWLLHSYIRTRNFGRSRMRAMSLKCGSIS